MYPSVTDNRAEREIDLQTLMAQCARYMLEHGHDLTPKQKQLLRDVEKGRYQFKVLSQLLEIAPSVNGGGNPLALSDAFRRATLVRMPEQSTSLIDATIEETIAQAALDPWQMRLLTERTPTIVDATLDRSGINLMKLQRYHDVLLRQPSGRRHFV